MPTYSTPGVYVEEIPSFPPSVAQVATAVPAFIGYSETDPGAPKRITSLLDFRMQFGGPQPLAYTATVPDGAEPTISTAPTPPTDDVPAFLLYHCVDLYFKNGGGPCYVVSAGVYADGEPTVDKLTKALEAVKREDEPTLIVLTDAVHLTKTAGNGDIHQPYYDLCKAALDQCATLGDRFAILDVLDSDNDATKGIGDGFRKGIGMNHLAYGAAYFPYLNTTLAYGDKDVKVTVGSESEAPLADIRATHPAVYQKIRKAVADISITLPPSAAVAGVYASVDRARGVWKAPANVSLNAVTGPTHKLTDDDQDRMNADATAGKSINALRAFTGRGTLVWGARTLDGNSNEWRYVPVRRLFNTIEESTRKATAFAVFEPNNRTTWLKVKAMIEGYLFGLWQQGAFMGTKPEDAYFVHVGLGQTMTDDDITNGRLIVEIGIAAVRPAEFIILRFSHKLPEA